MESTIKRNLFDYKNNNRDLKSTDRFLDNKFNKYEFSLSKIKSLNKKTEKKINKNLTFNENLVKDENQKNYDKLIENSIGNNFFDDNFSLVKRTKLNFEIEDDTMDFSLKTNEYRKINENVFKVLDAPGIIDDYYTNILDWSDNNMIVVSLKFGIYLWCPKTCKAEKIYKNEPKNFINNNYGNITSLKSSSYNSKIVLGYSNGIINYLDYNEKKVDYSDKIGCNRICTLDISGNLICFGNKNGNVYFKDFRDNKEIKSMNIHSQEICKVKFSEDHNYIASGGNDNSFNIFDIRKMKVLYKENKHKSGVRAISWSNKNRNIIVSGGGTNDKTIKIWDTRNHLKLIKSINTGSQVCNLIHSKNTNELISSHGYNDNNIYIWKLDNYNPEKIGILKGSNERVLHLCISPCGENLVSGSGDETLRFYKPFPKNFIKSENLLEEKFKSMLR